MRKLALLSNDDGFSSEGIRALRAALLATFDVVTVAPESEQSAASHALTLHRPLRIRVVSEEDAIYTVDGTPADCVYIALHAANLLPRPPDVVVSGVNHGANLGQDVFYSGTVAAAREGALRGIPSLAASAHPRASFAAAAELAARIAASLSAHAPSAAGAPPRERLRAPLYSLNVPKEWSASNGQVVATTLGTRFYDEIVDMRVDPRGREYCWIGGPGVSHEDREGTDTAGFNEGRAVLTPLVLDLTDHRADALTRRVLQGSQR